MARYCTPRSEWWTRAGQIRALAPARPDGHFQGAGGQVRVQARGGSPADDPPGVHVGDERDVHPAAESTHICVGSAGGALPAFSQVNFRRPPSEPDMHIPVFAILMAGWVIGGFLDRR